MNCINCNNISLNTRDTYFATQLLRLIDNNNNNKSPHSLDLRLGVLRIFECEKSKQDFPVRSEVSIDKTIVNQLPTMKQMIMQQMLTKKSTCIICFFAILSSLHAVQQLSTLNSLYRRLGLSPKVFFRFFSLKLTLKKFLILSLIYGMWRFIIIIIITYYLLLLSVIRDNKTQQGIHIPHHICTCYVKKIQQWGWQWKYSQ